MRLSLHILYISVHSCMLFKTFTHVCGNEEDRLSVKKVAVGMLRVTVRSRKIETSFSETSG